MPAPLNPNLWPSVLHDEDGNPISPTNPLPVDVIVALGDVTIEAIKQVQNVETVAPLGAGGSFAGAARDSENFESFGISVYLEPDTGETVAATAVVENSLDGTTWREVDRITLNGSVADETVQLNRVYSVTRRYYRVSVTNDDGTNAMAATEVISMMKPI